MSNTDFLNAFFVLQADDESFHIVKNTDSRFLGCVLSAKRRSDLTPGSNVEILETDGMKVYKLRYKGKTASECMEFIEAKRRLHFLSDLTEKDVRDQVDAYSVDIQKKFAVVAKLVDQIRQESGHKDGRGDAGQNKKARSFEDQLRGRLVNQ